MGDSYDILTPVSVGIGATLVTSKSCRFRGADLIATAATQVILYKNGTSGTTVGGTIIGAVGVAANTSNFFMLPGQDTIPCPNGLSVSLHGATGPILNLTAFVE